MTRAELILIWEAINRIHDAYNENAIPPHSGYRRIVKKSIDEIKRLIQNEIGQME